MMDIRQLTQSYAVAPQIEADDMAQLKALGFTTVISNRPDHEIGPDQASARLKAAAEAAGLVWVNNPVEGSGMTEANIIAQRAAIAAATGPVFAYCRSGTRSAITWALSQADAIPVDALIEAAAGGGYDLQPYRARISAMAGGA